MLEIPVWLNTEMEYQMTTRNMFFMPFPEVNCWGQLSNLAKYVYSYLK